MQNAICIRPFFDLPNTPNTHRLEINIAIDLFTTQYYHAVVVIIVIAM